MRPLVALLLLAPALSAAQTERYTLAGADVAIYNLVGEIRAEPGTGPDVTIEVTRSGPDAAKLTVETGMLRSRNTLRVIFPDRRIVYPALGRRSSTTMSVSDDGTFGDDDRGHRVRITGDGSGLEASAVVRVMIPGGRTARLNLGAGRVNVSNVKGNLYIDVAAAEVSTENTAGDLTLDTGSGDTHVTKAAGSLNLDSGSGDVTLTGVHGALLQVDAGSGTVHGDDIVVERAELDVGSGGISIGGFRARTIVLDSGSGDVDLGLTGDVDDMTVDSGSGDVTIRIPATLGARLDVDAGSGGVSAEMNIMVTQYDSDRLVGTLGDGKGTIRIESGSGAVHLLRAN